MTESFDDIARLLRPSTTDTREVYDRVAARSDQFRELSLKLAGGPTRLRWRLLALGEDPLAQLWAF